MPPDRESGTRAGVTWTAALGVSVLFHLLVWQGAPDWKSPPFPADGAQPVEAEEGPSQIELVFEGSAPAVPVPEVKPPEPAQPANFGQVNPDLPAEEPDREDFFGAANQRQAQKSPMLKEPETVSKIEGELADSTSVKTGHSISEGTPEMLPGAYNLGGATKPGQNLPRQASAPAPAPPQPSFYEARPDLETTPDGLASRLSPAEKGREEAAGKKANDSTSLVALNLPESPQRREGAEQGGTASAAEAQRNGVPAPRPRPKLSPDVFSQVVMKRDGNAQQAAGQALNLKFSQYGEYLAKMFESIEARWHELNRTVPSISGEVGTDALILFRINRLGEVVSCEIRRSTTSRVTASVCMDAIKSRAPYGPWTEEMVRVLNEEEEIVIHFHYR